MAKSIMIQGTMSNAGKSLLCAGLCRIFKQDGYRVAPFKSQNMALNSFITADGGEMGRAQVVQAEAAGIAPDVRMNPILLKPTTDVGSQVIVNGTVQGNMRAMEYYRRKREFVPAVMEAYRSLAEEYDILVIEGAGSPAEINLKQEDIVNMGLARLVDAPVLLVGDIDRFGTFKKFLFKSNTSVKLIGYVSMDDNPDERYLGSVKDLEKIVHENAIGQVYIMHRKTDLVDIQEYIDACLDMGVSVRIIVKLFQAHGAQRYVSSVGTYPVVTYHRVCLNDSSRAMKRIIDIIGSLIGIILSSPIMLITAIAIKLDSKGPVIFKQERAGINGKIFKMYKFRSMCVDAEELKAKLQEQNEVKDGMMFKIKDDPRITKVGKFIRKTSIDELPQFFNVLIGNMSLVGTRPPTLDEVAKYERTHWRRMSIKPGITGMWQVSGRSQITDFDEIVELDTIYIDQWSIMLDFKIMFKTVICMLRKKGAY